MGSAVTELARADYADAIQWVLDANDLARRFFALAFYDFLLSRARLPGGYHRRVAGHVTRAPERISPRPQRPWRAGHHRSAGP
jgi:hypothetical protein